MVLRFVLIAFLAASVPRSIADADAVASDPVSAARAQNERYYEHVRLAYLQDDCVQFWGEFPVRSDVAAAFESESSLKTPALSSSSSIRGGAGKGNANSMVLTRHRQRRRLRTIQNNTDTDTDTDTTSTSTNTNTTDKSMGGMPCTCGMLYDLGQSSIDEYIRENGFAAATPIIAYQNTYKGGTASSTSTSYSQGTATPTALQRSQKCVNGFAGDYPCNNVDLVAYLPKNSIRLHDTGYPPFNANDLWGWTSSDNREFVIWGVEQGTFFVEIFDDDDNPLFVWGFLPSSTGYRLQRDMKVVGDYAYVGAEADYHGIQIFDMNRLLTIDPNTDCAGDDASYCTVLEADTLYTGGTGYSLGRTHNIVANAETNYLYLVGGENGCSGGLHVVNVADPLNPKFVACFGDDGYVHDAHCVVYKGPDANYKGKEICVCFNQYKITIVDVSDKNDMRIVSTTYYKETSYTHQGWLSTDHTHVVFGDEIDELNQYYENEEEEYNTRTLVIELRDLANPSPEVKEHYGDTLSMDHNQYIVPATAPGQDHDAALYQNTDLIYQANYNAGLNVLQVIDYDEGELLQVGTFQTHPYKIDYPKGVGAWSTYPYFASGLVPVSSIQEGLFIVRPDLRKALKPPGNDDKCQDSSTLNFRNKDRGCDWVGKTNPRWTDKKNRKRVRKRCRKTWRNRRLRSYCLTTCGRVGIGACRNLV